MKKYTKGRGKISSEYTKKGTDQSLYPFICKKP